MFARRRRKKKLAEEAAAADPSSATASTGGSITPEPLVDLPPEPPAPEPPAPEPPALEPPPPEPPPPEPPPLRYFAEGAEPTVEPEPEPAPEPERTPPVFRFTPVDEAPPPASGPPAVRPSGTQLVALPNGNRALAERMRASQQEMAQLSMHMDAWMDQAAQLRTELMVEWDADGLRPSYTDLVVRAVARSLVRHPYLNSALRDDAIELLTDVNVGITTPLDDDVSVHVVGDADQRSLKEIVAASPRVGEEPNTTVEEPEPTFVVASLGEYGVDSFTPVVLAPNVATLGIGRVRDETRWEGDRPVRASMMTLVLSWDHRAFGGVTAAEFLVEVREMLEQPYRLLVD